MDVVVPIASEDPAFENRYDLPKPLVEVRGRPMIRWATSCVEWVDEASYVFPVLETHVEEYDIDDRLRDLYGRDIRLVPIDGMTDGAARTVLRTREHLSSDELIVLFGDQYIHAPVRRTISTSAADGLIAVFTASDPRWSYAKTNERGVVTEVAEKEVISSTATAGLYYFETGTDFVRGAERMIRKDIRTNGLFYVCPVYNELIEMGRRIETFSVDDMHSLGTLSDVTAFENAAEE